MFRQTCRQLFSRVFSTVFSRLSSGSPRLLLPGCVKNSITASGPQLGRVAVIKLHQSASRGGCVSQFFLSFSQLHLSACPPLSTSLFFSFWRFFFFLFLPLSFSLKEWLTIWDITLSLPARLNLTNPHCIVFKL